MIDQIQLWLTISLCTLIWLIQIVHYPSFEFYEEHSFTRGMLAHQKQISFIVLPLMICELALAIFSTFNEMNLRNMILLGFTLLIWISTFFVQVPLHNRLTRRKNDDDIKKLVQTNWIRTGLWSFKLVYVFAIQSA